MDDNYIRQKITQLRLQKNVSEYRMSMDLGHSKGYIQSISSGRALPSMGEFLAICDYFGITPFEFFSASEEEIVLPNEIKEGIQKLDKKDVELLIQIIKRLSK